MHVQTSVIGRCSTRWHRCTGTCCPLRSVTTPSHQCRTVPVHAARTPAISHHVEQTVHKRLDCTCCSIRSAMVTYTREHGQQAHGRHQRVERAVQIAAAEAPSSSSRAGGASLQIACPCCVRSAALSSRQRAHCSRSAAAAPCLMRRTAVVRACAHQARACALPADVALRVLLCVDARFARH